MSDAQLGPLICAGCHECCRNQTIFLDPDECERGYEMSIRPDGAVTLCQQVTGDCIYLGPKGCLIYPLRPRVCRVFDCRQLTGTGLLAKIGRDRRKNGWRLALEANRKGVKP